LERQPVRSSNLRSVSYDAEKRNLEIEFHSGIVHQYQNVPSAIHTGLMSASSAGTFYTEKIRNRYRSIRVNGQAAPEKR